MSKRYSDAQEAIIRQVGIRTLNQLALQPTEDALQTLRGLVQNQHEEEPYIAPTVNFERSAAHAADKRLSSRQSVDQPWGPSPWPEDGQDDDRDDDTRRQGRQGLMLNVPGHNDGPSTTEEPYIAPECQW